jgi:hypothetical protein
MPPIAKKFGEDFLHPVFFRRRLPQPLILLAPLREGKLAVQHRMIKRNCRKIATSTRSKLKCFALLGVAPASPMEGKGAYSGWLIGEHQGREIEQLCR